MSIFSKIKGSKRAAQQHKAAAEEQQQKQEQAAVTKVPYKHVPTHAAVDALSGAPSTWKNEDRAKILEHHKRRSQMTISRTQSTLSIVSSINHTLEPTAGPSSLPRTMSYDNTWNNRVGDVSYLTEKLQPRPQTYRSKSSMSRCVPGIDSAISRSPSSSRYQSKGKLYSLLKNLISNSITNFMMLKLHPQLLVPETVRKHYPPHHHLPVILKLLLPPVSHEDYNLKILSNLNQSYLKIMIFSPGYTPVPPENWAKHHSRQRHKFNSLSQHQSS